MDVCSFIKAVLAQDENTIRSFFHKDAYVNWHCSNEHFTVDEFIIANCEYPGDWDGTVERVEVIGDLFITVTKVYPQDRSVYFHVVSFIRTANDKITSMDEYWADDGNPPQWRTTMHLPPCSDTPVSRQPAANRASWDISSRRWSWPGDTNP